MALDVVLGVANSIKIRTPQFEPLATGLIQT